MTDNLRDRIAAVLDESLHRQKGIDRPARFKDWIDNRELADAVLEMLTVHIPPIVASAEKAAVLQRLYGEGAR